MDPGFESGLIAACVIVVVGAVLLVLARARSWSHRRALIDDVRRLGLDVPASAGLGEIGGPVEGIADGLSASVLETRALRRGPSEGVALMRIRVELTPSLCGLGLDVRFGTAQEQRRLADDDLAHTLGMGLIARAGVKQDALQVMSQPEVAAALHKLPAPPDGLRIADGFLVLDLPVVGSPPRDVAKAVAAAIRVMEEALQRPVVELAHQQGWEVDRQVEGLRVHGPLGEGRIVLRTGIGPGSRVPGTLVRVTRDDLPEWLRVRRHRKGDEDRYPNLGDLVLDGMVTFQGDEISEARELLCHDDIRGLLLSVIHGRDGSRIGGRGVVLVAPGQCRDDLLALIEETAELAQLLGRRWASMERPNGVLCP